MARDTRTNLKTHFQTGDIPTQGNYADFIDSKFNLVDQNSGSLFLTGSVNISASNSTDVFKVESVSSISLKSSPVTGNYTGKGFNFNSINLGSSNISVVGDITHLGNYTSSLNAKFGSATSNTFDIAGKLTVAGDTVLKNLSSSTILVESASTHINAMEYFAFPLYSFVVGDVGNQKQMRYYGSIHKFMAGSVIMGTSDSDPSNGTATLAINNSNGNGNLFVKTHITASNISASGTLTAEDLVISDDATITDTLTVGTIANIVTTNITASNITASGTIIADNFTSTGGDDNGINFTDGVNITGNITSSGNMKIAGNISSSGALEGRYRRHIHQISTNATLSTKHEGAYVRCGPHIVTIPANSAVSYPIGTEIEFIQTSSTGHLYFNSGSTGVTLNSRHSLFSASGQFSAISCKKVATDEWDVIGDLTK